MPLSEHEERILAEIERQLEADDPRFARRARKAAGSREVQTRRLRWSVVGFVVGLLTLLGLTFHLVFGFVGFGLMLASVIVGVRSLGALSSDGDDALGDKLRRTFGSDG